MAPGIDKICIEPSVRTVSSDLPPCKIGINGFGRIGRNVLRASLLRDDTEVVVIYHTCATIEDVIHLILHDSTHGSLSKAFGHAFEISPLPNGNLSIDGREIALTSERDLEKLDWGRYGAVYVAECSGKFKTVKLASTHVDHGKAKKVLISAPSPDAPTFVFKVNSSDYRSERRSTVFSCASCTTNCLAPIAKVINDNFGRSVIGNIIPTTTGAAKAISTVLPELTGKLTGISIRVPTTNVSMVDLTVNTAVSTSLSDILLALRKASQSSLLGVVAVTDEELVSCDFLGHSCSAIVDAKASVELNPQFFKIVAWYDNEWGYSSRLLDMLAFIARSDAESERMNE